MYSVFLTLVPKLLWVLVQWWWNKNRRAERAREIVSLLKKIRKEGDVLGDQIAEEMSRTSSTPWEKIPIRDENKEPNQIDSPKEDVRPSESNASSGDKEDPGE